MIVAHNNNFDFPAPTPKRTSLLDVLETNPINAKVINRPDTVFTKKNSTTDKFIWRN